MSPEEMTRTFQQFAALFLGQLPCDEEIPFVEKLDRSALDGSIDSLHVVDRYLSFVRDHIEQLTTADFNNLALRCGAYVGECIRLTWPESYDWCDYNDFMLTRPDLKSMIPERNLGTCAMLTRGPHSMLMPLNKVLRYLYEGPENSVHNFAHCERQYHLKDQTRDAGWLIKFCRRLASFGRKTLVPDDAS